jgi:hypothetical protein
MHYRFKFVLTTCRYDVVLSAVQKVVNDDVGQRGTADLCLAVLG